MKIVFLQSRNLSLPDKIEMALTQGKWTHCILLCDQAVNGDPLIIESTWQSGPRFNFWSQFQYRIYEIWEFDSGTVDYMNWGKSKYGNFYAYGLTVGMLLKPFLGVDRTERFLSWASSMLAKIGVSYNPLTEGAWCSQFCGEFIELTPSKLNLVMTWLDPEVLYMSVALSPNFKKIAEQK